MNVLREVEDRLLNLTKPPGSLGYLEEIVKIYSRITGIFPPKPPLKKVVFVFAGDHGIAEEGVSAYPQEVTPQMVLNFLRGGAAINVIARGVGADVFVVDVGVKGIGSIEGLISRKIREGTRNFLKEPAMTEEETKTSIEIGREMADMAEKKNYQLIIPGDMGIGNTTPSTAIISFITQTPPEKITGRGTGISDERFRKKVEVIKFALEKYRPKDGFSALRFFGGYEIGAIAGLILGAYERKIPVVLDGIISLAGFLVAYSINPSVKDGVFAGHMSFEPSAKAVFDYVGLRPILDLDMRLGEGTGGALASFIIDISLKIFHEMATFESAGVSKKID